MQIHSVRDQRRVITCKLEELLTMSLRQRDFDHDQLRPADFGGQKNRFTLQLRALRAVPSITIYSRLLAKCVLDRTRSSECEAGKHIISHCVIRPQRCRQQGDNVPDIDV